jgi:phosphatidylglycerol:prolipoprotein diacylglycerol transferase
MPFLWNVEREIFAIGPLALRWYSLLFALGFVSGYFIMRNMFRKEGRDETVLDSLLFHVVAGTVIGARLGHCLFYEPATYLNDPIRILKVWEGGLASHGGYFGVMIAIVLFCRKYKDYSFLWVADRVAIPALLAGGFIRLGNFFNSEIIGRPWDGPWAVVFQKLDNVARHPSQIYEAIGYMSVSLILYIVYRAAGRQPLEGRLFGLVMVLSYSFRTFIEQFKENQEPFEADMVLNMGQLLSLPFIVIGLFFAFGLHAKVPFIQRHLMARPAGQSDAEKETPPGQGGVSRKGQLRKLSKKAK